MILDEPQPAWESESESESEEEVFRWLAGLFGRGRPSTPPPAPTPAAGGPTTPVAAPAGGRSVYRDEVEAARARLQAARDTTVAAIAARARAVEAHAAAVAARQRAEHSPPSPIALGAKTMFEYSGLIRLHLQALDRDVATKQAAINTAEAAIGAARQQEAIALQNFQQLSARRRP